MKILRTESNFTGSYKKECVTIGKKSNNAREKQTMSDHKNDIFKKQQTHNASQNVYLILIGTGDLTISA